ncbi:unnamed protein product [Adineta steineri]|uniref:NAD(P)(+)--arginine ADP-ribosyltransferase n=1 Tax=Adineta steineri TaxID=433720 RepID=A0A818LZV2_9BILA|nr:unnamed protein product [Adineta steineri]CAF3580052.1 unnamed protein product [Adineta steineri]
MASSDICQPRQRITQNYLLLWVDTSIDQTNEDYENTLQQIRTITGDVNVFTQRDACIDFLTDAQEDVKSFLIIKDAMFQQIMPLINDIPQLHGVYIFNDIKTLHEEWTKKCHKIKSIHTNIDDLCHALQIDIKQLNQDSIAMSFITVNEMAPTNNLNQLEPTFMYTQLFKEILLDMEHDKQAIKNFITYCRHNDSVSSTIIDRFEKEYNPQLAIWWYTFQSNIYYMLNYALRTMDADIIITMGFFLRDIHKQIQQLHEQQVDSYDKKHFVVYRGQGLMMSDFEKLQNTKGGLISFNNFLSTSTNKEVSLGFAQAALTESNKAGILFIMSIDPCIKSTPFASIKEVSAVKSEEEILFSMHTVFRVSEIKQMGNDNQLYQVELQLTSDDDQQLRLLTDQIRKEAGGDSGWQGLGKLLVKIGRFNKAEELFNVLLEQTSNEGEKAIYYIQLGSVHCHQGNYEKATSYIEHGLEIQKKTFPSNHPKLAASYNNAGFVYGSMGVYSKALSFYETALEISQKTVPSNHPLLTASYNNIGLLYENMGQYSKALSFYEKVLEISKKTLPSNHPNIATTYNNIGKVCDNMGEYLKALSFYKKTLAIRQKTLPENHPDFAQSYNNIGMVYDNIGDNSKALSFYEKALEIYQKTLPSNHPLLATSYNNIGSVYYSMEEHSKALSSHQKALEIREKTLPSNHPDFAQSYSNIGNVYSNMGEHSKALSSHEKALKIYQKTLPSNHPLLATAYNNIGSVYSNIGEYSKALSSLEKALELRRKTLPSYHPDLAASYNNISFVYCMVGEYSKALSCLERALNIWQRALPPTHPYIKSVKESIEIVKTNL